MAALLEEALNLADRGRGATSPNPAVGALLEKDGQVVGRGYHTWARRDHAEIAALKEAGSAASGATLYVTLEPCSHQGRTGPCTTALIEAGVTRVVAAMEDPNPMVKGEGFRRLREANVEVTIDDGYRAAAEKLNEAYVNFMQTGKPLVTVKAALTLDGKIAAPHDNLDLDGDPAPANNWITSETARADVQKVRHQADAILTGIGTVLEDDCLLTDRSGLERSRPLLRIVLDSQLRLPLHSKMVRSVNDDLLVVGTSTGSLERRRVLEEAGVKVLIADGSGGRTDLDAVIRYLAERRYLSLMVEAGSKVNWTILDGKIADKILFYYAPKILGGLKSLPVAGGQGRMRRADALLLHNLSIHSIAADEFAVEAYLVKH